MRIYINKSCCIDGILHCHCRDGFDCFGKNCSSCLGRGYNLCHCSKATYLDALVSYTLVNSISIELLFKQKQKLAYSIICDFLFLNFHSIELACQKTFLDFHFLKPLLKNLFSKSDTMAPWPAIFVNDPRPFSSQFQSWIETLLRGFSTQLPLHYDLSIMFRALKLLCKYDIEMKPLTEFSKNEIFIFTVKAAAFSHRYKQTGLSESLLDNELYFRDHNEFEQAI